MFSCIDNIRLIDDEYDKNDFDEDRNECADIGLVTSFALKSKLNSPSKDIMRPPETLEFLCAAVLFARGQCFNEVRALFRTRKQVGLPLLGLCEWVFGGRLKCRLCLGLCKFVMRTIFHILRYFSCSSYL